MSKNRRYENGSKRTFGGMRYIQALLLFIGISTAFALRVNLSVAIVAMTDKTSANPDFAEYDWSEQMKSIILSSFFWGYVITQIPAGHLAVKYGGKVMLFIAVFNSSIISLFFPFLIDFGGWKLVCFMRFLQGISQGVIFPSVHTILSKWAPPEERGILGIFVYSGGQFGIVLMLAVSGILASSPLGWPSAFYIPGIVGVFWSILWFFAGASSPYTCKYITEEEETFIEYSLAGQASNSEDKKSLKFPLFKVLTSVPFMALILMHCASNWGFWTLLTQMPNYIKNVLGMNIKDNALLSALPYLANLIVGFILSGVSTILNRQRCMSLSMSRKFFNSIGFWIPAIFICALGYVDSSNPILAVALLTVTIGMNAASFLGFLVNHIDLSPNFAGILMGITNFTANTMSIIAPLVVGFVVTKEDDISQWRLVFFITSGFYFFGNLVFIIFGSANVQPWNSPQDEHIKVPTYEVEDSEPIELNPTKLE